MSSVGRQKQSMKRVMSKHPFVWRAEKNETQSFWSLSLNIYVLKGSGGDQNKGKKFQLLCDLKWMLGWRVAKLSLFLLHPSDEMFITCIINRYHSNFLPCFGAFLMSSESCMWNKLSNMHKSALNVLFLCIHALAWMEFRWLQNVWMLKSGYIFVDCV